MKYTIWKSRFIITSSIILIFIFLINCLMLYSQTIKAQSFELIDARGRERFLGLQPEARKELRSGNIEGSKNMPFTELINNDRTFKKKEELMSIFEKNKVNPNKKIAFTCGSGITACVLGLTNSIISGKKPVVYDGSWSEYGIK